MTASELSDVPLPRIQVWISGWIIECGDLAVPVTGDILHDLGLRIYSNGISGRLELTQVNGKVCWARFDRHNHRIETLLELDSYAILTQAPGTARTPLPAIGSRIDFSSNLCGIPPYEYADEFVDFELPDVRMDWRVLAVMWDSDGDGVMVDLEPVQLRTGKSSAGKSRLRPWVNCMKAWRLLHSRT